IQICFFLNGPFFPFQLRSTFSKYAIVLFFLTENANGPKTISDITLINAGKILENDRTLAESTAPVGEPLEGVMTMHVLVKPALKNEKLPPGSPRKTSCGCCIL
ncbi:hypothetical protein KP509_10G051400, partial [Ceratopteris richardii]